MLIRAIYMALAGMMVMAAAVGIGRFAYTPLLPAMQQALDWSLAQAGDIASANFLGYMIGALLAAPLGQRNDRHRWLALAMLVSIATTAAGATALSFPLWLALRFLSGIASALCLVLSTAIVIEYVSRCGRPQLGAVHFAGVGVGIVVSVGAIEWLKLYESSVFAQWLGLGVVALVLFAVAWTIMQKASSLAITTNPNNIDDSPASSAPPSRRLKKLIIAYGFFGFGYIITATFIVVIARQLDHAAIIEPLTWVIVGLIAAPSVLIWQRIASKYGILRALRIAYALEAIGVLLAGFGFGHFALLAGGALLGGTFMGITALGLIAARQFSPSSSQQTKAIAWMTASFGLGQWLGPAIAGRLAQLTNGFVLPSIVAASLLIAGIVLLNDRHRV